MVTILPIRLKEIRERKGITKTELSRESGVVVRTIKRIEEHDGAPRIMKMARVVGAINQFVDRERGDSNKYSFNDVFPNDEPREKERRSYHPNQVEHDAWREAWGDCALQDLGRRLVG